MKRRRQPAHLWAIAIGFIFLVVLGLRELVHDTSKSLDPGRLDTRLCNRARYPRQPDLISDQLTVLINGFKEERMQLLERHVQAYSASPVVHSVYILWGNTSTSEQVLLNANLESLGAPIYVVRQPSYSLNYRFLPRTYIQTRAVLVCDDDITITLESLKFAFQVWRENQDRIVGFFPRSHFHQPDSNSWIYVKRNDRYSILLTKFMILETEFLYLYSCSLPPGVREYVDEGLNCEDIAMNFLVSNRTGKGPLLVEGKARDWGDPRNSNAGLVSEALSARSGHRKNRGECITEFQRAWGGMQLKYSYFKASADVREQSMCDYNGAEVECDKVGVER